MHVTIFNNLPVNKLASVFGSTSATYKFYWLIALIEMVEEGNIEIPKRKIFARMISNCWYAINYFHMVIGCVSRKEESEMQTFFCYVITYFVYLYIYRPYY